MKFTGVIFGFHFMGNSEVIWNYGILHLLHDHKNKLHVMQCITAGFRENTFSDRQFARTSW